MKIWNKLMHIQFGWKHILIIFTVLILFQVVVSRLQQNTIRDLLSDTMDWYKKNSAEQIGNLTTTSLELLLESEPLNTSEDKSDREKNIVHALNSILKQPLMKRNVEEMCIIIPYKNRFIAMDLGQTLYAYFYDHQISFIPARSNYDMAVSRYAKIHSQMLESEMITSFQEAQNIFHVFVPLVPFGEYSGAVYLKIHPDVSFISQQILTNFKKTVLIFSSLILTGLLAMFFLSTYTIRERDEARELLYKERETHLQEHIAQQKEHLFTKRIYHTHHKAEKIMGFINEDLENIDSSNIEEVRYKTSKYANFISRVIYDMKWYSPPIQTIRDSAFKTDLNELLRFIINNIFLRISYPVKNIQFKFNLDEKLPTVSVNEFVVWEIIEPLIQNSIDHASTDVIIVTITTEYDAENKATDLIIDDNGKGISDDLLTENEFGIKKIFLENISTKEEGENSGYGCYLAYEISKRCGWKINAMNNENGGGRIILIIKH